MSGLFGGKKSASIEAPTLAGIQVQTSAYGGVVPIVYGTARLSGNVIYLPDSDFVAIAHKDKQGVGKGGGSVTQTSYTYDATLILALCEGPIAGVNLVWADKDRLTSGLASYGFSLFTGARGQAVWTYLSSHHPSDAIAYSGTAYVAAAPIHLGSTASLKNFGFEVQGFNIIGGGIQDAHPADIILDFLTNVYFGAGWNGARVANMAIGPDGTAASSYRQYCTAATFFLSPAFKDQRPASQHLRDLLDATNADVIFSQGVLKVLAYGDVPQTGNGVTFTPYTTPIYDLTDDDFLVDSPGQDPITVTRPPLRDTFNVLPVEFADRAGDYNPNVVQDVDPVDADLYGIRQGATAALHAITAQPMALAISRIRAQRSLYVRNVYTFRLGWKYILLDPMDLVTLTEPTFGLTAKVVRIREIVEDDRGTLTVTAEEWPFGVASPTLYATQTGDGGTPNTAVDPGNAAAPFIFDVPALYGKENAATANPQVGIAAAGGKWFGGCDVYVSGDGGTTYALAGTLNGKSRYGVTTSALAAGASFDTTHTVGVDLTISGGALASVSDAAAQSLLPLCLLDGELLAPATDALTSAYHYTLSRIQRGAYGTVNGAHSSPVNFVRLDENVFLYSIPTEWLGATLKFKLVAFNIFGGGYQDIASVSVYTFTPSTTTSLIPPMPDTVILSISSTPPAGYPSSVVLKTLTNYVAAPDGTDPVQPGFRPGRYATVTWSQVSIKPASLLTGFEVALFTGSDPNDLSSYVVPKEIVAASAQGIATNLPAAVGSVTINAAVRAIYGADPSSWRLSTGSAVLSPGTVPLNVPVSIAFTQTASDRDTVTFTVYVTDPLSQYVTAPLYVQWAGLTSVIDNQTGNPVAASFSCTLGAGYSFTAHLNPQFRGAGYIRFRMNVAGRADSYATWLAAERDQDAAPNTELSIDNAGVTAIAINTPNNVATVKWLASNSAYPTTAAVIAGGTIASGGSPFLFALGITLALGETIYFTGIPYDTYGTAGQTLQVKKTRETISASKTIQFTASQFVEENVSGVPVWQHLIDQITTGFPGGGYDFFFYANFILPDNATVTAVGAELYRDGTHGPVAASFYATPVGSAPGGNFAIVNATNTAAWQVVAASCSQSTTGQRFQAVVELDPIDNTVVKLAFRSISVTYTPANTQATI